MSDKQEQPQKGDKDRVAIPLDPEEALRGLLKVDPESPSNEESSEREQRRK
jgi:hypothetical protein